jgi:hypothetical protein
MENKHGRRLNVYRLRLQKEKKIPEDEIQERMRWDKPVLSANQKCSISLDLPVLNCRPTKVCAEVCYASQGRQLYRKTLSKALAINRMIDEDPERAARKMVGEAAGRAIRLAGSGEMLPEHKMLVDCITRYGGSWWGFTRRVDTHNALSDLVFSIDASTSASVLQYVSDAVPVQRRAYLRRPGDAPPPLEVAVVFPVHGLWTSYVNTVPSHEADCPAVRGDAASCWWCQRCY